MCRHFWRKKNKGCDQKKGETDMKKWIALVLAALMLVAALSACAAKKAEAPAETTSEQTAESPKTVSEETYYYI